MRNTVRCSTPSAERSTASAERSTASAERSTASAERSTPSAECSTPQQAFVPAYDPYDHTAEFDPKDISDNKVFAMLCYLMDFIGIIVALLATHSSKYTMFHIRQALKITVVSILSVFVLIIPFLGWIAFPILQGIIWVIKIISFFQICSGKAKEPAIIRSFGFLR